MCGGNEGRRQGKKTHCRKNLTLFSFNNESSKDITSKVTRQGEGSSFLFHISEIPGSNRDPAIN